MFYVMRLQIACAHSASQLAFAAYCEQMASQLAFTACCEQMASQPAPSRGSWQLRYVSRAAYFTILLYNFRYSFAEAFQEKSSVIARCIISRQRFGWFLYTSSAQSMA